MRKERLKEKQSRYMRKVVEELRLDRNQRSVGEVKGWPKEGQKNDAELGVLLRGVWTVFCRK